MSNLLVRMYNEKSKSMMKGERGERGEKGEKGGAGKGERGEDDRGEDDRESVKKREERIPTSMRTSF